MNISNIIEVIVLELFEEFQKDYQLNCTCDQCKNDILALALNNIPPKYVATDKGEILIKALYSDIQKKRGIMKELAVAATTVEKNPNHY
ncbi:late competence development ComFB family protein [Microbacteriaceae bacterium 4G12]